MNIYRVIYSLFKDKRLRKILLAAFIVTFSLTIFMQVAIQWLVTKHPPSSIGFLSPPPYVNISEIVVLWISSRYDVVIPFLTGDINWIIIITLPLFLLILLSSMIVALTIAQLLHYSSLKKGRCRLEKGVGSVASAFLITGVASASSAVLSCPACSFTFVSTLAALAIAGVTGSTYGLSSLYIQFMYYTFGIGIIINIIMFMVLTWRISILYRTRN